MGLEAYSQPGQHSVASWSLGDANRGALYLAYARGEQLGEARGTDPPEPRAFPFPGLT